MPYTPSPQAKATTDAVLAAFDSLSAKRKRDAEFRARMLAAQVKVRNHQKGHKAAFSQSMALEVLGKLSLLLLKRGAV